MIEAVKGGSLDLDDPKMTLELLRAESVVGVKGFFNDDKKLISARDQLCVLSLDGR